MPKYTYQSDFFSAFAKPEHYRWELNEAGDRIFTLIPGTFTRALGLTGVLTGLGLLVFAYFFSLTFRTTNQRSFLRSLTFYLAFSLVFQAFL